MPSTNYFLSLEEYNKYFPNLQRVNCMFTSFIRTYNLKHRFMIRVHSFDLDSSKEIGESYLCKVDELKPYIGYGREAFRRIRYVREADTANEFRLIFGHQPRTITYNFNMAEFNKTFFDFHVVIGVRDSFTQKVRWYHKLGVSETLPREVTMDDWKNIWDTYTCNPPALFAFYEPHTEKR